MWLAIIQSDSEGRGVLDVNPIRVLAVLCPNTKQQPFFCTCWTSEGCV